MLSRGLLGGQRRIIAVGAARRLLATGRPSGPASPASGPAPAPSTPSPPSSSALPSIPSKASSANKSKQHPSSNSKGPDPKRPFVPRPNHYTNANNGSQNKKREDPLQKRILLVRKVARVTKGGKIRTTSAVVVVGNGNGVAGYGEGRAADTNGAITKATALAIKNMIPFPRFQHRTVFGDIVHQYQSVRLDIKTAPPGFGIVANNNIHEICQCIGIRDLAAKVRGSLNPLNVVKATFEALQLQRTPTEIAQARGRKVVDIANAYYGGKM